MGNAGAAGRGARAIVTSGSAEKLAKAVALGAAHGINYRTSDVLTEVQALTGGDGVDLAIDGIGKETLVTSFAATNQAGRVVRYGSLTGGTELPTEYLARTFKLGGVATYPDWAAAMRFLAQVPLQPVIDSTFVLEGFEAAFAHLKQQKQFGKIVFTIGA